MKLVLAKKIKYFKKSEIKYVSVPKFSEFEVNTYATKFKNECDLVVFATKSCIFFIIIDFS